MQTETQKMLAEMGVQIIPHDRPVFSMTDYPEIEEFMEEIEAQSDTSEGGQFGMGT